jgi:WD40 repeat protein
MAPSAAAWHTADCLAAGCGELVKVWQPGNPNSEIKIFEGTSVYCLDFSRNNKVLAVAGDKGQVALYSSRPQTPSGERIVGRAPEVPKAALDSFTCVRWAPSGTHLVGGTRNGMLCIFALKAKQVSCCQLGSAQSAGQQLMHDLTWRHNCGQQQRKYASSWWKGSPILPAGTLPSLPQVPQYHQGLHCKCTSSSGSMWICLQQC